MTPHITSIVQSAIEHGRFSFAAMVGLYIAIGVEIAILVAIEIMRRRGWFL